MLGLYVHIPFCVHRCSYCDFYSTTRFDDSAFGRLFEKLKWEAKEASAFAREKKLAPVSSVFFGGGTPSLAPLPLLNDFFHTLTDVFSFAENPEITLEANPETVTAEFATGLALTRVNRVSLGAQSFQTQHLNSLERRGSAESIRRAVGHLRRAGFRNYSLDLIFGIPGQTCQQWESDIDEALALEPKHLSFYNLTLKPAHPLYSRLPGDDEVADFYEKGVERLRKHGFEPYEISNASLPGYESRHNRLYWSGEDFLGLGPSAASRFFQDGTFFHRKQVSNWETYEGQNRFPDPPFIPTSFSETLLEAAFLELRKREGIELSVFESRYGYNLLSSRHYRALKEAALIDHTGSILKLAPRGWLLAEGIAQKLIEPHEPGDLRVY